MANHRKIDGKVAGDKDEAINGTIDDKTTERNDWIVEREQ